MVKPDLSPDTMTKLRAYAGLLEAFAPRLGLVSEADLGRIWERHVLDSLRALPCLARDDALLVDVGSGGGLPGVPIALASPDRRVVLIEPMRRRAAFLELVVDQVPAPNASVVVARGEEVVMSADVCLIRALASPIRMWSIASGLLNQRGRVLYYAGRSWNRTLAERLGRTGAVVSVCREPELPWQGPIVALSPSRADPEE